MPPPAINTAKLYGILVTYRRDNMLEETLQSLAIQDRRVDHLFVVDNAPSGAGESAVERYRGAGLSADYLPSPLNVGPAGGIAMGMKALLKKAGSSDWVVLLDDDDPPTRSQTLGVLWSFAHMALGIDPNTAGVGRGGSRFSRRRGIVKRI